MANQKRKKKLTDNETTFLKLCTDLVDSNDDIHVKKLSDFLQIRRSPRFFNINSTYINGDTALWFILKDMTISINYVRNKNGNERRKIEIMSLLINKGSNVHIRKKGIGIGYGYKDSMLHVACNILDNPLSIVKVLLHSGIHADVMNDHDQTPLHFASERHNYGIMSLLIKYGADVNARDKNGDTPITLLMQSGFGEFYLHIKKKMIECEKCISLLIRSGADINDVNRSGATPLFMVVNGMAYDFNKSEASRLISILIKFGADVNIGLMIGYDDCYEQYSIGDTPLHAAVKRNSLFLVNKLLQCYPNVNLLNKCNMTVLDCATIFNHTTIRLELEKYIKKSIAVIHTDNE